MDNSDDFVVIHLFVEQRSATLCGLYLYPPEPEPEPDPGLGFGYTGPIHTDHHPSVTCGRCKMGMPKTGRKITYVFKLNI